MQAIITLQIKKNENVTNKLSILKLHALHINSYGLESKYRVHKDHGGLHNGL